MSCRTVAIVSSSLLAACAYAGESYWPTPAAPAVPDADGFAIIAHAAVPPTKQRVYKAIFDATQAASDPARLLPALNMAGSELNALAASGIALSHAHFAVVFHGAAINGILRDAAYQAKYGVANPNLATIRKMKDAGVEFFVCGQNLAGDNIDPATLVPEVAVASDALIVLMTYQNQGYALLSF